MREIKFRGKRKDNVEWVYGSLINKFWAYSVTNVPVCEILTPALENGDCWEYYVSDENSVVEVYPESVGQFTGLYDKNYNEIYEGDIISSENFSSNLVIGYSNEKAAFVGSRTNSFKISEIYNFLDDIVIDDNWEVIGNIYENIDLL